MTPPSPCVEHPRGDSLHGGPCWSRGTQGRGLGGFQEALPRWPWPGFCSHPWYKARVSSTALRGEFGQLQRKWLGKDARAEQNSEGSPLLSLLRSRVTMSQRGRKCAHMFFTTTRKCLRAPLCRSFLWELVKVWPILPLTTHSGPRTGRVFSLVFFFFFKLPCWFYVPLGLGISVWGALLLGLCSRGTAGDLFKPLNPACYPQALRLDLGLGAGWVPRNLSLQMPQVVLQ